MASACVNNSPGIPWLPPMISFDSPPEADKSACSSPERPDPADFEFRLDDPVAMLPADELFSGGKLVPLQMAAAAAQADPTAEIHYPAAPVGPQTVSDTCLLSPKAPRCSRRWRELLGLKKLQNPRSEPEKASSSASRTPNPRSFRHLLHRNPKSPLDSPLSLPLLRESDTDSSISLSSSRFSLSSTSSSCDSSDLPRHSLDSEKPSQIPVRVGSHRVDGPARVRVSRPVRRASADAESPRMNSCGKVVFNGGGLERSSSSPGSFSGGPRVRPRGMERSYSAHVVRVNPVLNVPVCSLRGSGKPGSVFGFFSSEKKKEKEKTKRETTPAQVGKSLEKREEKM